VHGEDTCVSVLDQDTFTACMANKRKRLVLDLIEVLFLIIAQFDVQGGTSLMASLQISGRSTAVPRA
jgi:hypothetical protein